MLAAIMAVVVMAVAGRADAAAPGPRPMHSDTYLWNAPDNGHLQRHTKARVGTVRVKEKTAGWTVSRAEWGGFRNGRVVAKTWTWPQRRG